VTLIGVVVTTGYWAWLDRTSPAVLAFVPLLMTLTAIAVRWAAGALLGPARRTFHHILQWVASALLASVTGLLALLATQPFEVGDLAGLWPAALAVGALIACAVEVALFVAGRLTSDGSSARLPSRSAA
jgi:hypothetical protein